VGLLFVLAWIVVDVSVWGMRGGLDVEVRDILIVSVWVVRDEGGEVEVGVGLFL